MDWCNHSAKHVLNKSHWSYTETIIQQPLSAIASFTTIVHGWILARQLMILYVESVLPAIQQTVLTRLLLSENNPRADKNPLLDKPGFSIRILWKSSINSSWKKYIPVKEKQCTSQIHTTLLLLAGLSFDFLIWVHKDPSTATVTWLNIWYGCSKHPWARWCGIHWVVTHAGTNRAGCFLTSLIKTNVITLCHATYSCIV